MFRPPLLPTSERFPFAARWRHGEHIVIDMRQLTGRFSGSHRLPDPPLVHSVAFSVTVPVNDTVERDGVVCDC